MTLKVSSPFSSPSQTMLPGAPKVSFTVGILVLTVVPKSHTSLPHCWLPHPHPKFHTEMTLGGSLQIGVFLLLCTWHCPHKRCISADLSSKAVCGSISQRVKRGLTDPQGHTVSQGQGWGQTVLADPCFCRSLPATNCKPSRRARRT